MAQWNLSVRLSARGSDLSRTLRESSTAARRLSRDVADARREITRLRQAARGDIRIGVRVDVRNLSGAATAIDSVRDASRGAARALGDLQRQARQAAGELGDLRTQALGAAAAIRSVGTATGRADRGLGDLSTRTRALRGDLDDLDGASRRAGEGLGGLRGRVGGVGSSSQRASGQVGDLKGALISLAPALIPLSAAATPLAVSLAAAGVGAAAFGAAVGGQIAALSEAADAAQKYEQAVSQHGRASQEALTAEAEMARQFAAMPDSTREAAAALSALKDEYKAWSDSLADHTMAPVTHGFQTLGAILPKLSPLVQGASRELDRLVTVTAGAVASPGFDALIDRLTNLSNRALHELVTDVIHLGQAAADFTQSSGFQEFLDYARTNGPLAADTVKNLALALMNLLEGGSEAGVTMLNVANAIAQMVNALPPEAIGLFIQAYTAFKLFSLGANMVTAATGSDAAAGVARFVRAARFGGVGPAIAGVTQQMGGLAKATLITAAAFGAFEVGKAIGEHFWKQTSFSVEDASEKIAKFGETGRITSGDVGRLETALKRVSGVDVSIFDKIYDFGTAHSSQEWEKFTGDIDAFDKSLAKMVSGGHAEEAKAYFEALKGSMSAKDWKKGGFDKQFGDYKAALKDLKTEQKLAAQAMGIFGDQAIATSGKLDAQKASAEGLRQAILNLNDTNRAAYDAETAFEQSIDDLAASFKKNGNTLDRNTQAGRDNASAMSAAAKAHDEMVAAGVAAGESLGSMQGKSDRLREKMLSLAEATGMSKDKAKEYVNTLLGAPGEIKTLVKLEKQEAISGLEEVQTEIARTPNAKSVTVKTLNAAAIAALEAVGLKTRRLPDGRTEVYTRNGQSLGSINSVWRALNNLNGKTATTYVVTYYKVKGNSRVPSGHYGGSTAGRSADGNIYGPAPRVQRFAAGGMRENHVAQIAQPTYRMWAEPETGGEAYIPLAASKRTRSRAIAEETVRRLGGGPVQWYADGGVTDWRYDPQTGSLYSTSDAGQAGHKTKKVKYKKHGKTYTKEVDYFSVSAVESKIKSAAKATRAWNADLALVADRVGGDVAEALAAMGKDGVALAKKMAHGSTKYINQMAAALRDLQKTARASLTDYTRQLSKATSMDATFAKNLAKLAAGGYDDLAKQLAAQNDQAAMDLAAQAVKSPSRARSANAAARTANNALTSDQVQQLVAIIAAISSSKTGIHDVAAKTGLGEDEIIAVATKASGQISSSLGSRATRFLGDLRKAQGGLAYASGGIREGIYATRGGLVRFAEPSTQGEAYIPLAASKRGNATRVLGDVAGRFGLGLTDANSGRVVIVREQGPLIREQHWHVGDGRRSDAHLIREIDSRNSYQLRRLARGGVGAR